MIMLLMLLLMLLLLLTTTTTTTTMSCCYCDWYRPSLRCEIYSNRTKPILASKIPFDDNESPACIFRSLLSLSKARISSSATSPRTPRWTGCFASCGY